MSKILISTTIECYNLINELTGLSQINTDIIENCSVQGTSQSMIDVVTNAGGFNNFAKQSDWIEQYQAVFNNNVLDEFNDNIAKVDCEGHLLVVDQALVTKRLSAFDITVGVVLNPSDFDFDHLLQHEGLTKTQAKNVCNSCNAWMIKNKDIYDVFIENKTIPEIIDIVKAL